MTKSVTVKVSDPTKYINFANVYFGEVPINADLSIEAQIELGSQNTEIVDYVEPETYMLSDTTLSSDQSVTVDTISSVYPVSTVIINDDNNLVQNTDVKYNLDLVASIRKIQEQLSM